MFYPLNSSCCDRVYKTILGRALKMEKHKFCILLADPYTGIYHLFYVADTVLLFRLHHPV